MKHIHIHFEDATKTGWVTLHGGGGGGDGSVHVKLGEGGRIVAGPRALEGKDVDKIDEPKKEETPAPINEVHAKIHDKTSAAHGGTIPKPGDLKKIYHSTHSKAALEILNGSFKSIHRLRPEAADEIYGTETDANKWIYFGQSKEAAEKASVSQGTVFHVNAEAARDRAVLHDDEGGIAMVHGGRLGSHMITHVETKDPQVQAAWDRIKKARAAHGH